MKVLLAWEMPALIGIVPFPKIRKRNDRLSIIKTSKNFMSYTVEGLEKGATDYLMNPFTKDILLGKITQITGNEV